MGRAIAQPSHRRKPSKPQGKAEQDGIADQIQQAIRITRTGTLLSIQQLPKPWRINPFITRGYTFAINKSDCFRNVIRLSNESFNTWSHIFGILSVLYLAFCDYPSTPLYAKASATDHLVIGIYLTAAVLCLSCSVFWHTMKCHCNPHFMINCASVDLMGITIMISAMNSVAQYTTIYLFPSLQRTYLSLTAVCCLASLALGWFPKFRQPDLAYVRVIVFTFLGILGLMPMGHIWIMKGLENAWRWYRPVWMKAVTPVFSGAWIYATKVPERWWPGIFDFCGHSHNIWHVMVLMTIWGGYGAAVELLWKGVGS